MNIRLPPIKGITTIRVVGGTRFEFSQLREENRRYSIKVRTGERRKGVLCYLEY